MSETLHRVMTREGVKLSFLVYRIGSQVFEVHVERGKRYRVEKGTLLLTGRQYTL